MEIATASLVPPAMRRTLIPAERMRSTNPFPIIEAMFIMTTSFAPTSFSAAIVASEAVPRPSTAMKPPPVAAAAAAAIGAVSIVRPSATYTRSTGPRKRRTARESA